MKLTVIRSIPPAPGSAAGGDYSQELNTRFVERVLTSLRGEAGCCAACGPDCTDCRRGYERRFGDEIVAVLDLPAVLPHVLERPEKYLPPAPPAHDVVLAVAIHEQVLLEVIRRAPEWGTRGVVAPLEAPGWISPAARAEGLRLGEELGVEVAFPKPFCAFRPPAGSLLDGFRRHFCIGHPEIRLRVEDGLIAEARVEVSAACGATYYVARWLEGKRVDEEIRYGVLSKRLHAYPCTASMEWDDELGDTPMHIAGHAHAEVLEQLGQRFPSEPGPIRTHLGVVLSGPLTGREGKEAMGRARDAILALIGERGEVEVSELTALAGVNPAAVASALIGLRQEGRVVVQGGLVSAAGGRSPSGS
ncbi:MAG: DUF166 domain-containing protein [Planctomycetota bacterium]|jgi:hypothetical protein